MDNGVGLEFHSACFWLSLLPYPVERDTHPGASTGDLDADGHSGIEES